MSTAVATQPATTMPIQTILAGLTALKTKLGNSEANKEVASKLDSTIAKLQKATNQEGSESKSLNLEQLQKMLAGIGLNGEYSQALWENIQETASKAKATQAAQSESAKASDADNKAKIVPIDAPLGPEFTEVKAKLIKSTLDLATNQKKDFRKLVDFTSETVKKLNANASSESKPASNTQPEQNKSKSSSISQAEMITDLTAFESITANAKSTLKEIQEAFTKLKPETQILLHKHISLTYVMQSQGPEKEKEAPTGLIPTLDAIKNKSTNDNNHIGKLYQTLEIAKNNEDEEKLKSFDFKKNSVNDFQKSYREYASRFANYNAMFLRGELDESSFHATIHDLSKQYSAEHVELLQESIKAVASKQSKSIMQSVGTYLEKFKDNIKYVLLIPAFISTMSALWGCITRGDFTGGLSTMGHAVEKFAMPLLAVNSFSASGNGNGHIGGNDGATMDPISSIPDGNDFAISDN